MYIKYFLPSPNPPTTCTTQNPHLPPRAKETGLIGEKAWAMEAAARIVKQVLMTLILYLWILADLKVVRLSGYLLCGAKTELQVWIKGWQTTSRRFCALTTFVGRSKERLPGCVLHEGFGPSTWRRLVGSSRILRWKWLRIHVDVYLRSVLCTTQFGLVQPTSQIQGQDLVFLIRSSDLLPPDPIQRYFN